MLLSGASHKLPRGKHPAGLLPIDVRYFRTFPIQRDEFPVRAKKFPAPEGAGNELQAVESAR